MEINDWYQIELLVLDNNTWNDLTVYTRMSSDSIKNATYKLFAHKLYIYIYIYYIYIYIYKHDLTLNNIQGLMS